MNRGRAAEVTLTQRQEGPPYEMEVEIAFDLADGSTRIERIRVDEAVENVTIELPSRALAVRLDPEHRLLLWRPEFGPPLSHEARADDASAAPRPPSS